LRKYLFAGLLVWLPLAITVGVLMWAIGLMDGLFHGIMAAVQRVLPNGSENFVGLLVGVPGLGVVLLAALVKSIYVSVKQVSDTLFSTNGNAFREAVLVQYPRHGSWTIAFVTGRPSGEVAAALPGEHVSLYVPTTPNPTSGFFLMVPRDACVPLAMSVDEALKYIISMGVVAPPAGAFAQPVGADPNRLG